MRRFSLIACAALIGLAPAATLAQDFAAQVNARQGQFRIMALNLGVLGGMAKGAMPYDAEAAQAAANNIVAISTLDQRAMWPEGSDNMSLDTTRADPAIWDNLDDMMAKWQAFGRAAEELQLAASSGAAVLGGALGELGATCSACHKAYRGPELQ